MWCCVKTGPSSCLLSPCDAVASFLKSSRNSPEENSLRLPFSSSSSDSSSFWSDALLWDALGRLWTQGKHTRLTLHNKNTQHTDKQNIFGYLIIANSSLSKTSRLGLRMFNNSARVEAFNRDFFVKALRVSTVFVLRLWQETPNRYAHIPGAHTLNLTWAARPSSSPLPRPKAQLQLGWIWSLDWQMFLFPMLAYSTLAWKITDDLVIRSRSNYFRVPYLLIS